VGLLDVLTGRHKLSRPAAEDRLFALSTAYVTLQAGYGIVSAGAAGIVFQPLATSDFQQTERDMEELVRATASESGVKVSTEDDKYGFRWMVMRTGGLEDLVVAVNAVSNALEGGGYGERILCAVFAFVDANKAPLYLIYNYKRGFWYPFVPAPGEQQRSTERELELKAQIGSELPIEPELERWFPLWGIPF
jgi:hypothetical protein